MANYQQPTKEEMIAFIEEHLGPINQSTPLNLREIKEKLLNIQDAKWRIISERMRKQNIPIKEWITNPENDEENTIIRRANSYVASIDPFRERDEIENIKLAKDVTAVSKRKNIPDILEKKIQTYGVIRPSNPKTEFDAYNRLGGKTRKKHKKIKIKRKRRKTKFNKRKAKY